MSIGVLKNGLGSLRNLHGLLASVRVGPRDLTAAVVTLQDDSDLLRVALGEVLPALNTKGLSAQCCKELGGFVEEALAQLSAEIEPLGNRSKISVAQRLRLEPVVLAAVTALGAALPLLEDLTLGCAARPGAPGLAELVHEPGPWETAPALGHFQAVHLHVPSSMEGVDLGVDVRTARSLISLSLSLVSNCSKHSAKTEKVSISAFTDPRSGTIYTTIAGDNSAAQGAAVPWRTYTKISPTRSCAEELARITSVKFKLQSSRRRVEIVWPGLAGLLDLA